MTAIHQVDGPRLRRVRRQRGIPVDILARAVGRSPSLIYSIEQGRTQPSDHVFALILLILNVPTDRITVEPLAA